MLPVPRGLFIAALRHLVPGLLLYLLINVPPV
jgi:hypothetical protein